MNSFALYFLGAIFFANFFELGLSLIKGATRAVYFSVPKTTRVTLKMYSYLVSTQMFIGITLKSHTKTNYFIHLDIVDIIIILLYKTANFSSTFTKVP
jgi:hypothetical protein